MNNLLYFVKTQNIRTDHRVHKELKSISIKCTSLKVIYNSNDDVKLSYPSKKIEIIGGAANKNFFLRMLGALVFTFKCLFIASKEKEKDFAWVCDPVLFILVYALSKLGYKVIWDHHELPPSWVLENSLLRKLFSLSYKESFFNIHANSSRQEYLESKINYKAFNSAIIKNLPSLGDFKEREFNPIFQKLPNDKPIAYIQNSLIKERCGGEICRALFDLGYFVVHAGSSVDQSYMKKHVTEKEMSDNLLLCGSLKLSEINYLLELSSLTLVFYRSTSLNQKYCEPNRIYQSMALNTNIVAGDNPTITNILKDYPNSYIAKTDGSDVDLIVEAIKRTESVNKVHYQYSDYWEGYADDFEKVIKS
ncbi:hypothetical protein [Photobacterium ganghwense]|uniref:hypothetical protein n=1 Tax=Photobacterium ganghwense TaxID=320778 RepID=UPI0039EE19A9